MLGRDAGKRNAHADKSSGVYNKYRQPVRGYHFVHTAIDGHSRLAYSELLADERKETAAAFWLRANTWFAECGFRVRNVLTDQRFLLPLPCLTRCAWRHQTPQDSPLPAQTNGKVQRFHRTCGISCLHG